MKVFDAFDALVFALQDSDFPMARNVIDEMVNNNGYYKLKYAIITDMQNWENDIFAPSTYIELTRDYGNNKIRRVPVPIEIITDESAKTIVATKPLVITSHARMMTDGIINEEPLCYDTFNTYVKHSLLRHDLDVTNYAYADLVAGMGFFKPVGLDVYPTAYYDVVKAIKESGCSDILMTYAPDMSCILIVGNYYHEDLDDKAKDMLYLLDHSMRIEFNHKSQVWQFMIIIADAVDNKTWKKFKGNNNK